MSEDGRSLLAALVDAWDKGDETWDLIAIEDVVEQARAFLAPTTHEHDWRVLARYPDSEEMPEGRSCFVCGAPEPDEAAIS